MDRWQKALQQLHQAGYLDSISFHLANRLFQLEANSSVALAAALCQQALLAGDLCYRIGRESEITVADPQGQSLVQVRLPEPQDWLAQLRNSRLVGANPSPLVLDAEGRLYLGRYHDFQERLALQIQARTQPKPLATKPEWVRARLQELFPKPSVPLDFQMLACLNSLFQNLTLITGGPGTGKTTTVSRLLGLQAALAAEIGQPLTRILLLAPTGKAAGRLQESLSQTLAPDLLQIAEPMTIHRALGVMPSPAPRFVHHPGNPLAAQLVILDEASMVDLPLLTRLLEALSPNCQIVLLGDRDQLASVEAGAVLGDLCNRAEYRGVSQSRWQAFQEVLELPDDPTLPPQAGIWDSITHLTQSHRFSAESDLGKLAEAFRQGNQSWIRQRCSGDSQLLVDLHTPTLQKEFSQAMREGFAEYFRSPTPLQALDHLLSFILLCSHRQGPWGSEAMNERLEALFEQQNWIQRSNPWYSMRPILITENYPSLELYNGDRGVIFADPKQERLQPMAYFKSLNGLRSLSVALLPQHETSFAMTIHKSQGSEFEQVALVIAPGEGPLITRELLYTGITRAKQKVQFFARLQDLAHAAQNPTQRDSGLKDRLWQS